MEGSRVSVRLNKLLAQRGLGARRKCDALIQSGVVRVNGATVLEPGLAVEPGRDRIEVRGRPLPPQDAPVYYVLHKPVGVISTLSDPEGRRTLRDFQPPGPRLFPVGRLDADTSGLLILTNDGALAHRLMHPRYGVSKLYRVHADRAPSAEMLRRLQEGIEFEPGVRSAPARVRVRDDSPGASVIELELHEGRYRQVRRMCEAAGLKVLRLHRWGYGPLRLGGLEHGLWRELSEEEVRRLRAASARPRPREPRPAGSGPRPPTGRVRRRPAPSVGEMRARPRERRERAFEPRAGGGMRARPRERRERALEPRAGSSRGTGSPGRRRAGARAGGGAMPIGRRGAPSFGRRGGAAPMGRRGRAAPIARRGGRGRAPTLGMGAGRPRRARSGGRPRG